MRKYQVVYCFLNKDGSVERHKDGMEKYHSQIVEAYNGYDAMKKLKKQENFIQTPEIVSVVVKEELCKQ